MSLNKLVKTKKKKDNNFFNALFSYFIAYNIFNLNYLYLYILFYLFLKTKNLKKILINVTKINSLHKVQ